MAILQLLYLLIPAYIANMIPVFVKGIPWNTPMDFGLSVGNVRIFGNNKTWKGFIAGVAGAILAGFIMSKFYWPFGFSAVYWSFLIGAGALLGDAVKSFFKRRVGIKPGNPWIPFDQVDYTIGALALGSLLFFPGWFNALILIVVSAFGHVISVRIGYLLGIRDVKW